MKNNLIKHISFAAFSLLMIVSFSACTLGEIGWPADSSYDKLFRPLVFSTYDLSETSTGIAFTKVVDADRYILEISEDSLQFTKIVRHLVIKADTLKPFMASTTAVQTLYHIPFTDLNANSAHSARITAINKDSSLTTTTMQFAFRTLAENIFRGARVTGNGATFRWKPTTKVSFLKISKDANPSKNVLNADSLISASEITDTTKVVTGLDPGTYYTAKICYNDGTTTRVRGSMTFKTPGTAGSYVCNLKTTDLINDSLTAFVAAGKTNVSFIFSNGETYNLGSVVVPAGMVRLTFTASAGVAPIVNLSKITPSGSMDGFLFENINMMGTATYLFSFGSAITFADFTFINCRIDNYTSVVYFKNAVSSVDNIIIDNCIVTNNGGYGVLNIGGSSVAAKTIRITNSTFISLLTQLMDIRTKLATLEVTNCTFYNNSSTNKLAQLFRFADNANTPGTFTVEKCLFGGNNGATTLKSMSSNYATTATLPFSTSYRTSDVPVSTATGVGFTDIKVLTLNSTDLFVDPNNADIQKVNLAIKPGVAFDGRGKVGDPRWWK